MNKRTAIYFGFICQVTGILLMNYFIQYQPGLVESLDKIFNYRDKLGYINQNELFLYLFMKRIKQGILFFLLYAYVSDVLAILIHGYYLVFMQGFIMAMSVYSNGIVGIFYGITLLSIPVYLNIIILIVLLVHRCKIQKNIHNKKYLGVFMIILYAICITFLEVKLNLKILSK